MLPQPLNRMENQSAPINLKPLLKFTTRFGIASFLLLTFYVLSLGPVAKLAHTGHLSVDTLQFYQPVSFLYGQSPVARSFLSWYLNSLWHLDTPYPSPS
jgi:hypothetical protein